MRRKFTLIEEIKLKKNQDNLANERNKLFSRKSMNAQISSRPFSLPISKAFAYSAVLYLPLLRRKFALSERKKKDEKTRQPSERTQQPIFMGKTWTHRNHQDHSAYHL